MDNMDFDKFLVSINKEAETQSDSELYLEDLFLRIERKLQEHNVACIASFDKLTQQQNIKAAYETNLLDIHDSCEKNGVYIDESKASIYARKTADLQLMHEHMFLTKVATLIAEHERPENETAQLSSQLLSARKKTFTAELLIEGRITSDSPILTFINDIVPGESLDLNKETDNAYLLEALEAHANKPEQIQKVDKLTHEAEVIMDGLNWETDEVLALLHKLALIIAGYPDDSDAATRQSKFAEIMRDNNLPEAISPQLLSILEEFYKNS